MDNLVEKIEINLRDCLQIVLVKERNQHLSLKLQKAINDLRKLARIHEWPTKNQKEEYSII